MSKTHCKHGVGVAAGIKCPECVAAQLRRQAEQRQVWRYKFAAHAMQALAPCTYKMADGEIVAAKMAVSYADALLEQLERTK